MNAPFSLVGKVIALLKAQKAVAGVLVQGVVRAWWSRWVQRNSEGVVYRLNFDKRDPRCRMVGSDSAPPQSRTGLSVVFFDFRECSDPILDWAPISADKLMGAWQDAGRPHGIRYYRSCGEWDEGLPGS